MKARPILFSGAMVRAILNGTKTQTRRVVKPQPKHAFPMKNGDGSLRGDFFLSEPDFERVGRSGCFCPYGVPGDRLWVRETHAPMVGGGWVYAADYTEERLKQKDGHGFWKPSIFMKREASRITLEIVSVRVERLGEISRKDAIAEGYPYTAMLFRAVDPWHPKDPIVWYADLWEKINGAGSWAENPWVEGEG